MSYDAVVLDMDGVIVERSPAWVFDDAATTALAEAGIDDATDEEFGMVRGLHGELDPADDHFEQKYDVSFDRLWRRRNELITANQLTAIAENEKTLYDDADAIRRLPAPRGIVSNNQQAAVENVLDRFDIADWFDAWFGLGPTTADIGLEKPNPTYMNRTLDRLDTRNAVYVGDRASDVAAAHEAGLDAALVRREFNDDLDPEPVPEFDVASLHDLVTQLDGQPAAE